MFDRLAKEVVSNGITALNLLEPDWLELMPAEVMRINFMGVCECPLYFVYGDFGYGAYKVRAAGFDIQECGFAEPKNAWGMSRFERSLLYAAINAEWHCRIADLRKDATCISATPL